MFAGDIDSRQRAFASSAVAAAQFRRSVAEFSMRIINIFPLVFLCLFVITQISCAAASKKWKNHEEEIVIAIVRSQISSMYDEADSWRLRRLQPNTGTHIYIALKYKSNSDPPDKVIQSVRDPNILFWKYSEGYLSGREWRNKETNNPGMILEINEPLATAPKMIKVSAKMGSIDCWEEASYVLKYEDKRWKLVTREPKPLDCAPPPPPVP